MLCKYLGLLWCVVVGLDLRRCSVWCVGSVPLGGVCGFIEVVDVSSCGVLSLYPGDVGWTGVRWLGVVRSLLLYLVLCGFCGCCVVVAVLWRVARGRCLCDCPRCFVVAGRGCPGGLVLCP